MSLVVVEPDMLATAAGELHTINATVRAGNAVAADPTTGLAPAAADVVSLLTATQFAAHARLYQEICAQAVTAQDQLAATLSISGGSYASTEAANAASVV